MADILSCSASTSARSSSSTCQESRFVSELINDSCPTAARLSDFYNGFELGRDPPAYKASPPCFDLSRLAASAFEAIPLRQDQATRSGRV